MNLTETERVSMYYTLMVNDDTLISCPPTEIQTGVSLQLLIDSVWVKCQLLMNNFIKPKYIIWVEDEHYMPYGPSQTIYRKVRI